MSWTLWMETLWCGERRRRSAALGILCMDTSFFNGVKDVLGVFRIPEEGFLGYQWDRLHGDAVELCPHIPTHECSVSTPAFHAAIVHVLLRLCNATLGG